MLLNDEIFALTFSNGTLNIFNNPQAARMHNPNDGMYANRSPTMPTTGFTILVNMEIVTKK